LIAGRFGAGICGGEKWCQLISVQHVGRLSKGKGFRMLKSLILLMLCFCLMEDGEDKGKRKGKEERETTKGEEGFPG
jgi:hypothetical protein